MRVLVATDGSDNSFEAIHQAARLISAEHDQLLLYYSPVYPEDIYDWNDEASQAWRNFVSTQVFEKARQHLPLEWSEKVEQIQGSSDPRTEISRFPRHEASNSSLLEHVGWALLDD